ncbi:MAG: nuclear transport factor 2 family protein [Pseudomonadota bacterium]
MFDETLSQIAGALVEHCRNGTEDEGLATLYSADVVSVEAMTMPGGMDRTSTGMDALKAKHAWWEANAEVHSSSVEGPFLFEPDRFAVIFEMDVTMEQMGGRFEAKEVGIFTVADGKIVREEFYYTPPPG